MSAREHDRVLDTRSKDVRKRIHLAARSLQLHEDGGEPLRQIVVNFAREPVSLLQRGFAAVFGALARREATDIQQKRRLARDRLDHRNLPLRALRVAAHEHDPTQIASPEREGRRMDHLDADATDRAPHRRRQARVIAFVDDRAPPSRDVFEEMARHALALPHDGVPLATLRRVEPTGLLAHPELDAPLVVVRQPDVAGQALALFYERLRERLEEALDAIRLAGQDVERQLHRIGLDLRERLRVAALSHLTQKRALELVWIGGDLIVGISHIFHRLLLFLFQGSPESRGAYPFSYGASGVLPTESGIVQW